MRAYAALIALLSACSAAPERAPPLPVVEVSESSRPAAASDPTSPPSDDDCRGNLLRAEALPRGTPDAMLFDEALALRRARDEDNALEQLLTLVERHPRSPFVPFAYLQFGEMFATEAERDSAKWVIAAQYFSESLKYPDHAAVAYAALRRGEMLQAMGEHSHALDAFSKAIDMTGHARCGAAVAARARSRMVESFVIVGQPGRAHAFFAHVAGPDEAVAMLVALAEALAAPDPTAAATVITDILARNPGAAVCARVRSLLERHPEVAARVPADRGC